MLEQPQPTHQQIKPQRAKFNTDAERHLQNAKKLVLVVSMENKKQAGEGLRAFFELVNKHKHQINEVEIILTAFLQRHYVREEKAQALYDEWLESNKEIFETLDKAISLKCTDWRPLVETEEFKEALSFVHDLYDKNEEFHEVTDALAKQHARKADVDCARAYVLEESAFGKIYKGRVCYPAVNLNGAVAFIAANYNPDLIFCGYSVFTPKYAATKERAVSAELPGTLSAANAPEYKISMARLMKHLGIHEPEAQKACYEEVINVMKRHGKDK